MQSCVVEGFVQVRQRRWETTKDEQRNGSRCKCTINFLWGLILLRVAGDGLAARVAGFWEPCHSAPSTTPLLPIQSRKRKRVLLKHRLVVIFYDERLWYNMVAFRHLPLKDSLMRDALFLLSEGRDTVQCARHITLQGLMLRLGLLQRLLRGRSSSCDTTL